jgi:hypothetical protein
MAFEKIGIEALFETKAFANGLKTYTSGLDRAMGQTSIASTRIGSALMQGLGKGVTAIGALSAAVFAGAGAIGAGITKIVFDAAMLGDAFAVQSDITGISTTRLQELAYAGKFLDVELDTIASANKFVTRSMYAARDGAGAQAEAYAKLGIKVMDSNGKLRDNGVVFGEVLDALRAMPNETERDAIAMTLMGRSAMELNPLIKAGSKALAEYTAEAHAMGAVISEEDIMALDLFQDQMDGMKLTFKVLTARLATKFLPVFQSVMTAFRNFFGSPVTQRWINLFIVGISRFVDILSNGGGLTAAVSEFMKFIPKMPSIGEILAKIFDFGEAGTGKLLDWVDSVDWTGMSQGLADKIAAIDWAQYGAQFGTMLSNLGNAIAIVFKETEWTALGSSIGTGFADFVVGAMKPGETWQTGVVDSWTGAFEAAKIGIQEYGWMEWVATAFMTVADALWAWVNEITWSVFGVRFQMTFQEAVQTSINNAWAGLVNSTPVQMVAALTSMVQTGIATAKSFNANWKTVGASMIQSIMDGVAGMWSNFSSWLLGLVQSLVNTALGMLAQIGGGIVPPGSSSGNGGRGSNTTNNVTNYNITATGSKSDATAIARAMQRQELSNAH